MGQDRKERKTKTTLRTCASCRKEDVPSEMIRWARGDDGAIVPDLAGKSFGRGAWTHPSQKCLKQLQKSLQRSFKASVSTSTEEALLLLREAATHRANQILGLARRRNLLVYGSDATRECWYKGDLFGLLVATDARAAAGASFVAEAIVAGSARAWGKKAQFGLLFGRSEVGVLGVRDRGLAISLFGAIAMALPVLESSSAIKANRENDVSSEVE